MEIAHKIRELRKAKKLSQGDVEKKTWLLQCYTSRVEHAHTIPSIETLEKYAQAFEVPLHRFFTDVRRWTGRTFRLRRMADLRGALLGKIASDLGRSLKRYCA
jgi:transcriptional regulator with XRE-family HTH domain